MAKFEQKDMSGSLFKNERREKDTHPHATGQCVIDGVPFWISAWTKTDKNGNKFQSLAFKPKTENTGSGVKHNPGKLEDDELGDIPF
jgi:hypothetical protein